MRPGIQFPALLFVQAAWLLAPGLLAGLELARRRIINSYFVVPVAAVVGCASGYAGVWAYLGNRRVAGIGAAFSITTIVIAGLAAALVVLSPAHRRLLRTVDVAVPLALLYLVSLFYCGVTFGCSVTTDVTSAAGLCHLTEPTGDNILPMIFANSVHHGDPHQIIWTWQQSARPPLQSGVVLMQTAVTQRSGWQLTSYLSVAILLQVLWVPALWAMGRSLRLTGRGLAIVTALCLFSGFFLFNSVFTWPKLLAAALAVTAFGLFFFERAGGWTWALGGLAAAEALLAHTGVVFALIPMGVALLLRRYRQHWRRYAVAGLIAVIMLVPWQLYQRLYDPPGDGLLKLHLAGGLASASDHRSFGQLLHDNYTQPSPGFIAKEKLENVTTLFGWPHDPRPLYGKGVTATLRAQEFRYTVAALGVFHLGWLVLLMRRSRRRLAEQVDLGRLKLMLILAGFAFGAWVLIMYGPPQAITAPFQNSYATMMLLYIPLGAAMTVLPRRVLWPVLAVQIGYGAAVWVGAVWWHHILHPSYVILGGLAGAATLTLLAALHRWQPDEPQDDVLAEPPPVTVSPPASMT
jgi:hypothetical protein